MKEPTKLVIIGLDGADGPFIQRLSSQGDLPHLAKLVDEGQWSDINVFENVGPAVVWPTFLTGLEPEEHAFFSEWAWIPETMSLERNDWRRLRPFWSLEAGRDPVVLGNSSIEIRPVTNKNSGQHTEEGFCILREGGPGMRLPETISIAQLRAAIIRATTGDDS